METLFRLFSGATAAVAALLAPVAPLVACAAAFMGADFAVGVFASRERARSAGRAWRFESRKAWRTVRKAAFAVTAIVMAWLTDHCIAGAGEPLLARAFAGFVCGVELWSFLENAAVLSDGPLFRRLQRIVGRRLGKEDDDE